MIAIGIDPSLKGTGLARLRLGLDTDRHTLVPRFEGACHITPNSKIENADLALRSESIWCEILEEMPIREPNVEVMVILEHPMTVVRGKKGQRNAASLPNYGYLVGYLSAQLMPYCKSRGWKYLRPSATEWTRFYPSTNKDKYKRRRVLLVAQMFELDPDILGPKSKAGDVADAVLLAHWGLTHAQEKDSPQEEAEAEEDDNQLRLRGQTHD